MSNIIAKMNAFETSFKEVNNKVTSLSHSVLKLEQELESLRNSTGTKLQLFNSDIIRLKQVTSELSGLLDMQVGPVTPKPKLVATPVATPVKSTPVPVPEPVAPVEFETEETKSETGPSIEYTADGETLALVEPGVKDVLESQGYRILGTLSRASQTFFKLRFVGA
jgi:hypothetical protein